MTNQEDRMSKLDDLYDQACEVLAKSLKALPDENYDTKDAFEIIDRWLAVREADRQYAPLKLNRVTELENEMNNLKKFVLQVDKAVAKRLEDLPSK
jgi:hypothetical protein